MPEFEKALATGADPATMIKSSPICSPGQVRALFNAGVNCFCFDSESQIRNLSNNAPGADVYLRIFITNQGSKLDLNRAGFWWPRPLLPRRRSFRWMNGPGWGG